MLNRFRAQIVVAVLAVLFGFVGGWLGGLAYYDRTASSDSSNAARQQRISDESELIAGIAAKAGPSVVSVEIERQVTTQDLFGFDIRSTEQAAGTGFIIDSRGTIVTNRHVVPRGTSNVSVTLADGTRYDNVKVLGRTTSSSSLDVAFLQIEDLKGKKVAPLPLGDSAAVKVGDRVVAIGNALGQFQNTVTSGIISGHGRDVIAAGEEGSEQLTDLFQTDAAINQGNSGGPLVDINGQVIGINTAVAGGSAQNIGFAIPINDVKGLIKTVLEKGRVEQPFLGVRYVSLTDNLAVQYNLSVKRGAYIVPSSGGESSIVAGSPAEQAGLREQDVITKVNNIKIDEQTSLSSALNRSAVGETVRLTILRGRQTITLDVTLAAAPTE